jgi:hypothetical protein
MIYLKFIMMGSLIGVVISCTLLYINIIKEIRWLSFRRGELILCGDVWCEGQIVEKKMFRGMRRSNVQFIGDKGTEGTCFKEAKSFFVADDSVIGYCKKHTPKCLEQDTRCVSISSKEAHDTIIVQKIMSC